jgi:uncharacterized protein YcbK (DUF882 family)
MAFAHGKATNRAEYAAASFIRPLPDVGPSIAFRPKQPQKQRGLGLEALAYAGSARASGRQFEALTKGGFKVAHKAVKTSCFPARLTGIIHDAERNFGAKAIVTSGYRSPSYNRRVRGAERSLHMACKAADIRIPGVKKTTLHSYLRQHPKRGGVGIYRNDWVHIDTGKRREWDWR